MILRSVAKAKVNLCLHVTGAKGGYHNLESLVAFADIGDEILMSQSDEMRLNVCGEFTQDAGCGSENLAMRAGILFAREGKKFDINLKKTLPVGAGLGGGSADAAAVARMLDADDCLKGLISLGADVPACFEGRPLWMDGIGGEISTLTDFPKVPTVLVFPRKCCSTNRVFSCFSDKFAKSLSKRPTEFKNTGDLFDFLLKTSNTLEGSATKIVPEISNILSALSDNGAVISRMSGAGSCCFGLFESDTNAQNATYRIKNQYPDWWTRCTHLLPSG